jgi:hypothetical protein
VCIYQTMMFCLLHVKYNFVRVTSKLGLSRRVTTKRSENKSPVSGILQRRHEDRIRIKDRQDRENRFMSSVLEPGRCHLSEAVLP